MQILKAFRMYYKFRVMSLSKQTVSWDLWRLLLWWCSIVADTGTGGW